jgi:hypothetical protein
MPVTEVQKAFSAKLLEQWETEQAEVREGKREPYTFRGLKGTEYNHWLEHRHGWPVDEDGDCVASFSCCQECGGYDPTPVEECSVCQIILRWFEEDQAA